MIRFWTRSWPIVSLMRKDTVTPSKKTALPSQDPFVVVRRCRRCWSLSAPVSGTAITLTPPPPLDDDYDEIDRDGLWPLSSPSANDVTRGKGGIRRHRRQRRLTWGGRLGERALTSGASSGRSSPTSGGGSAVVVVWTGQRRARGQKRRRGVRQRQRGGGGGQRSGHTTTNHRRER